MDRVAKTRLRMLQIIVRAFGFFKFGTSSSVSRETTLQEKVQDKIIYETNRVAFSKQCSVQGYSSIRKTT